MNITKSIKPETDISKSTSNILDKNTQHIRK